MLLSFLYPSSVSLPAGLHLQAKGCWPVSRRAYASRGGRKSGMADGGEGSEGFLLYASSPYPLCWAAYPCLRHLAGPSPPASCCLLFLTPPRTLEPLLLGCTPVYLGGGLAGLLLLLHYLSLLLRAVPPHLSGECSSPSLRTFLLHKASLLYTCHSLSVTTMRCMLAYLARSAGYRGRETACGAA